MKQTILLFILISGFAFGQKKKTPTINKAEKTITGDHKFAPPDKPQQFIFTNGFMNNDVVINIKGIKKEDAYIRVVNYIKKNYTNYNSVVQSEIPNEMIRFQGISYGGLDFSSLHENDGLYYQLQIDFKDEKIKITKQSLKMVTEDHKKYELDNPLPEKYSEANEYNISYNFKNVPTVLNRIISEIVSYVQNQEKSDW